MGILFSVITVGLGLLLAASPWIYDFETNRALVAAAVVLGAAGVMVGVVQIFEEKAERESQPPSRSRSPGASPFPSDASLRDHTGQTATLRTRHGGPAEHRM